MIKADRIPQNDIHQVRANLAERVAARVAASQQVVVARQQLALAVGVPPEAIGTIPDPAEELPEVTAPEDKPEVMRRYIELALTQRSDYLAARKRTEAERAFLAQARNGLLPNVELTFSSGYSGLSEGAAVTLPRLFKACAGSTRWPGCDTALRPATTSPPEGCRKPKRRSSRPSCARLRSRGRSLRRWWWP